MTTLSFATPATTNENGRTISGLVAPYGKPGYASTGKTQIRAGAITVPEEIKRVKLLLDHDPARPVGYATAAEEKEDGLHMSFTLADTPAGNAALAEARAGLRDGLSVRVQATEEDGIVQRAGLCEVVNADLIECSLVAIPAFADARISEGVKAAFINPETPTKEEETMTNTKTKPVEDTEKVEAKPGETTGGEMRAAMAEQAPKPKKVTAASIAHTVATVMASGGNASEVRAALSDITPEVDKANGIAPNRPAYLGELWTASNIDRPFIDAITTKPLTAMKMWGFKWKKRATVDEYAGNKKDIPSSTVETEALEAVANRYAGGWDIDRIFVDLGDASVINSIFAHAVDDYRLKTEAAVAKTIQEKATAVDGSKTVLEALAALGTRASKIGSRLDFVALSAQAWAELAAIPRDMLPWWITGSLNLAGGGNVAGLNLFTAPALTGNTVIAGDKRAATFFEKPPIRVDAIDLAHGGVDLGVFGYAATLVEGAEAIFKATVTAPAHTEAA